VKIQNQLNRDYWTSAIKAALGVSKGEGGIERYGETLTPVIDLWSMPEWAFLRKDQPFAFFTSASAFAAEFSFVGLSVPTNSGLVLVIEKVLARSGSASAFLQMPLRSTIAATLTQGTNTFARDNRFVAQGQAAPTGPVETWTGTDAAPLNSNMDEVITTATTYAKFETPPWVVRPGTGLVVQGATVNTSLQTVWVGRVHAGFPGELVGNL
jgi:hypothetical protein